MTWILEIQTMDPGKSFYKQSADAAGHCTEQGCPLLLAMEILPYILPEWPLDFFRSFHSIPSFLTASGYIRTWHRGRKNMNVVYRFRIYPNKIQQELFAKTFGCVWFVYNRMLSEKKECYEKTGKSFYMQSVGAAGHCTEQGCPLLLAMEILPYILPGSIVWFSEIQVKKESC